MFAPCAATTVPQDDRARDGAVVVRASGPFTDGIGAGTIVAVDGTSVAILTAKHVATFGPLTVRFSVDVNVPAHILRLVPNRDLALLGAEVDPVFAATLHPAPVANPSRNTFVHVWGSGYDGPAYEPAAVHDPRADLPDGPAGQRYALDCALCHQGDSGAGVFDAGGQLVGVYVGFFETDAGRCSVAELPIAPEGFGLPSISNLARSNTSSTAARNASASSSAVASATGPDAVMAALLSR